MNTVYSFLSNLKSRFHTIFLNIFFLILNGLSLNRLREQNSTQMLKHHLSHFHTNFFNKILFKRYILHNFMETLFN
jgi:hypothetical protein